MKSHFSVCNMFLLLIIVSLVGSHFAEGLECYRCTSTKSDVHDTQYSEFCEDGPTPEKLSRGLIKNCTPNDSILIDGGTGNTMDPQEVQQMESVPYRCATWTDRNKQFGRGCIAVIGSETGIKYNKSCFPVVVGGVPADICPCDGAKCNGPKRTNGCPSFAPTTTMFIYVLVVMTMAFVAK